MRRSKSRRADLSRSGVRRNPGIRNERLENRLLYSASAYTWQNAAIGGGGFVDGVFFSPTQQNVMYARTDIGGLYKSTNGGTSWQQLLDFVGSSASTSGNGTQFQELGVLSFAMDPENPNNLYADVGEYSGTNGDVLYSTNAGQTWTATPLSFYVGGNSNGRGTGERLAVDPYDSNVIFLGSNDSGLWMSTNAAHSFTKVSSFPSVGSAGVTFVSYDPNVGTKGSPSQTIYVGVNSTAAGSNVYKTSNGGSTWTELAGTAAPTAFIPMHGVVASNGNVYFTFSNALPPSNNITNGAVYEYNATTLKWTLISPQIPNLSSTTPFGYDGLAVDPENPNTISVGSFDRYDAGDQVWRTTNANSASPTWVALFDFQGYGGYNTTRNTSAAPWVAAFSDGTGNWVATVAIDPFNPAHLVYGTGQGLWATNNATTTATLTAANSWYFPDTGIEFTAAIDIAAAPSGVPLLSALGDINGFAHTTLTSSPAQGAIEAGGLGTDTSIDFAQSNPSYIAYVGTTGSTDGAYSTNDGATFTEFASEPSGANSGTVAVAANGASIAWAPSGLGVYYSTNNGSSWTASTLPSGTATGGSVISDRINPNDFYYFTGSQLYVSTNGGVSFTLGATGLSSGNLAANPYAAGDLWLATSAGVYRSTNYGQSFSRVSTVSSSEIAIGKSAPGSTIPAIYVFGTISNFRGIYRSDDGGATWTQVNDVNHQFGGLIDTMAADPNVFGRVYLGVNGRGVIVGQPTSAVPTGWTDQDINTPGNPGFATSSVTLSTGTTVNTWIVNGGGAGIGGTSDQFNFASRTVIGDATVSAQLTGLTNADGTSGTPAAGVAFRAGTGASDPFVALVQTSSNTLMLESRLTSGTTVTTTTLTGVPLGSEYLEVVRAGSSFTAMYSADGSTWTPLGAAVVVAAIPTPAVAGLVVSADYNAQLASATFAQVNVAVVPPKVTSVTVDSTAWASSFLTYLSSNGLGNNGYAIPAGAGQLRALPWNTLNQIQIQFNQSVNVTSTELTLAGVNVPSYAISAFSYDPVAFVATWTLASSIADDKLNIGLSDAISATSYGALLDGAWTNSVSTFPSGNGGTGSNFNFQIDVLPGDVDGNGLVNASDALAIRPLLTDSTTTPGYSIFDDIDGNGLLNASDALAVRPLLTNALPSADPTPLVQSAAAIQPLTTVKKTSTAAVARTAVTTQQAVPFKLKSLKSPFEAF